VRQPGKTDLRALAAPLWLALIGCGAALAEDSTTLSQKYAASKSIVLKLCVLPVGATLSKVSMKGGEPMTKESEEWRPKVDQAVRNEIVASGATVIADYTSDSVTDPVRQAMVELEQKYSGLLTQMRKRQSEVRKGVATLGDEVALLPCAADAAALVLVGASGNLQTGARKTVQFVSGGLMGFTSFRSDLWMALISARSGDVDALGHIELIGSEKFASDPGAAYGKSLRRQLQKMRVGDVETK
jgi:hypothetical protein